MQGIFILVNKDIDGQVNNQKSGGGSTINFSDLNLP